MRYGITVKNEQGATDGTVCATVEECKAWLNERYSDVANLSAEITEGPGREYVTHKPLGQMDWE